MTPTATLNHDLVGMWKRLNRFIDEAQNCQSSNTSALIPADVNRFASYLSAMRFYHDHVVASPGLDLPEINPKSYELNAPPVEKEIENESVSDWCRLMGICRDELLHSQSSRISSGLIKFDSVRFLAIISKLELFMSDYIAKATPIDLPETSPRAKISGQGRTGIHAT